MKVHDILHNKEKKVNFLWILYGLVLVILFLVSSTDLIIKEETAKIYPISVVIGDVSDENYVNFRKGMERAAMEFNGRWKPGSHRSAGGCGDGSRHAAG